MPSPGKFGVIFCLWRLVNTGGNLFDALHAYINTHFCLITGRSRSQTEKNHKTFWASVITPWGAEMLAHYDWSFQHCGYKCLFLSVPKRTAHSKKVFFISSPCLAPFHKSQGSLVTAVLQKFPWTPFSSLPSRPFQCVVFNPTQASNSCSTWRQVKDASSKLSVVFTVNILWAGMGAVILQRNVGQECVVGCGKPLWVVEESLYETEAANQAEAQQIPPLPALIL